MYKVDDIIMYSKVGVCRVADVGKLDDPYVDPEKDYYTLEPLFEPFIVHIPVDTDLPMREVMTKKEAEAFIKEIPNIKLGNAKQKSSDMKNAFNERLDTQRVEDLITVVKTFDKKNKDATHDGKMLSTTDQNYMKQAEKLLFGEFAVALGIEYDQVKGYIEKKLAKIEEKAKEARKLAREEKAKLKAKEEKAAERAKKTATKAKKDATKTAAKTKKEAAKTATKVKKEATKKVTKAKKDASKKAAKTKKDATKTAAKVKKTATKTATKAKKDATKKVAKTKKEVTKTAAKTKKEVTKKATKAKKDAKKTATKAKKDATKTAAKVKKAASKAKKK